jgi:hypothetical protein
MMTVGACCPGALRPERFLRFIRENSYPNRRRFRYPDLANKKEGELSIRFTTRRHSQACPGMM